MGGTGMKEVRGAVFAGSSPPFLGRERAAVDVDAGPGRRSPRYHDDVMFITMFFSRAVPAIKNIGGFHGQQRWTLLVCLQGREVYN